jgi:acyl dehydratase
MMAEPEAIARCLYFEDVSEGQALPELTRRLDLTSMVMYAAATWDFHRYHYDDQFAKAAGFSGPMVDGQMLGALLAKQVMDWAGHEALLQQLSYRVRHMVFPNDTIVSRGSVVEKRPTAGGGVAICELSVLNQDSVQVIKQARASVELPRRPAATTAKS